MEPVPVDDTLSDERRFPSKSELRRESICSAAARSIAEVGIAGLRVEQVAAAAGVSVALIYYHFNDRMGLAKAAIILASERAPSTELQEVLDDHTGYDAVEATLLAELDDDPLVRNAAIVWGEAGARAAYDRDFQPIVGDITRTWAANVVWAIECGVSDGSIRPDVEPNRTAQVLITLVDGLCIRWLAEALSLDEARSLLRGTLRKELLPLES